MNNSIKQKLIDFFGNCDEMEGGYQIHVGPKTAGFDIDIRISDDSLIAFNVLVDIDSDIFEILRRNIVEWSESLELDFDAEKKVLNVKVRVLDLNEAIDIFLSCIKTIYCSLMEKFPYVAWRVLGEIQIDMLGYRVSVLSRDFSKPERCGWRGEIITVMPNEQGWFTSNFGKDNINLPLLSIVRDSTIYAYGVAENNILKPYNLTEIKNSIINEIKEIDGSAVILPRDESELLEHLGDLINYIEMLKVSIEESALSFIPLNIDEREKKVLKQKIEQLLAYTSLLRKIIGLNEAIRKKISIRFALEKARNILQREQNALIANVRKVAKLGAGKAVYIGKEELKMMPLGEKVLVSVIEERGKKKIVIEPI